MSIADQIYYNNPNANDGYKVGERLKLKNPKTYNIDKQCFENDYQEYIIKEKTFDGGLIVEGKENKKTLKLFPGLLERFERC